MRNMKKLVLMLSFLILLSTFSYAIEIEDIQCFEDGGIKIEATKGKQEMVRGTDVIINSTYTLTKEKWFRVNGTWTNEYIIATQGKEIGEVIPTVFRSEEILFNQPGKYDVVIYIKNQDTINLSVYCPGFKFSCELFDLSLKKCYSKDNQFYAKFYYKELTKNNERNKKSLNLISDINYILDAQKPYYDFTKQNYKQRNSLPEGSIVDTIGNDYYVLKSKFDQNNVVEKIIMQIKDCDGYTYEAGWTYPNTRTDLINCGIYPECVSDSDCRDGWCDKEIGFCRILKCGKCEEIINGVCTPIKNCCKIAEDCNDSLVCTTDSCNNGQCIHEKVTCEKSANPCVTGECIEPKGCQYYPNPECGTKNISQTLIIIGIAIVIAIFLGTFILRRKNKN